MGSSLRRRILLISLVYVCLIFKVYPVSEQLKLSFTAWLEPTATPEWLTNLHIERKLALSTFDSSPSTTSCSLTAQPLVVLRNYTMSLTRPSSPEDSPLAFKDWFQIQLASQSELRAPCLDGDNECTGSSEQDLSSIVHDTFDYPILEADGQLTPACYFAPPLYTQSAMKSNPTYEAQQTALQYDIGFQRAYPLYTPYPPTKRRSPNHSHRPFNRNSVRRTLNPIPLTPPSLPGSAKLDEFSPEIRNMIYGHLLVFKNPLAQVRRNEDTRSVDRHGPFNRNIGRLQGALNSQTRRPPVTLPLLFVNKAIGFEAKTFFYGSNTFRISLFHESEDMPNLRDYKMMKLQVIDVIRAHRPLVPFKGIELAKPSASRLISRIMDLQNVTSVSVTCEDLLSFTTAATQFSKPVTATTEARLVSSKFGKLVYIRGKQHFEAYSPILERAWLVASATENNVQMYPAWPIWPQILTMLSNSANQGTGRTHIELLRFFDRVNDNGHSSLTLKGVEGPSERLAQFTMTLLKIFKGRLINDGWRVFMDDEWVEIDQDYVLQDGEGRWDFREGM